MDAFIINGGRPLRGTVRIHGSKNAALPLMAAALMTDQPVTLHDVPDLVDIRNMTRLLASLGCAPTPPPEVASARPETPPETPPGASPEATPKAAPASQEASAGGRYAGINELLPHPPAAQEKTSGDAGATSGDTTSGDAGTTSGRAGETSGGGGGMRMQTTDASNTVAHYDIVRTMRAGICVLGPLLGARGEASVSMPGGCAIGDRPVDLHLRGLRALGAQITLEAGYIHAKAPGGGGRLTGAHVFLGGPNGSSVLGTANVMCAAALARGTTLIESAACEPEIEDLADLLNAMGARITGAGGPTITIEGVEKLHGCEHTVIPDRIEAGTYVAAAAITNGDVQLTNFPTGMLTAFLDRCREVGVDLERTVPDGQSPTGVPGSRETVRVMSRRRLTPVQIVTQPHPGFPTDLQAQMMALLTLADGNSIITEKIFPDRFMHVPELLRMGANITRTGPSAIVTGARELVGAPVMASDLRASAGLVIAGLAARGQTQINRVYHLDRGYQQMELTLQELGADIKRINDRDNA